MEIMIWIKQTIKYDFSWKSSVFFTLHHRLSNLTKHNLKIFKLVSLWCIKERRVVLFSPNQSSVVINPIQNLSWKRRNNFFNGKLQRWTKCGPPTNFCGPWTFFCYEKKQHVDLLLPESWSKAVNKSITKTKKKILLRLFWIARPVMKK